MALFRVYLFTYRRHSLLPRALTSLIRQTFTDWLCEIHNDDPSDLFPSQITATLNDPRILVVNHDTNLGPTRSFNLAFRDVPEPFICLLEDDNWWEPHFLQTMLDAMAVYPEVQVAWANMRIWQEEPDGKWTDTRRNIWDTLGSSGAELFYWGQPKQVMSACHSNGTLVFRSHCAHRFTVPDGTLSAVVEPVRERAFPFPLLFVPDVCANFALTRGTSRSNDRILWDQFQILLIASFFKHAHITDELGRLIWSRARIKPRSIANLIFAALTCEGCRVLLRYTEPADWIYFFAFCMRRPRLAFRSCKAMEDHHQVWAFLDSKTRERVAESKHLPSSQKCVEALF